MMMKEWKRQIPKEAENDEKKSKLQKSSEKRKNRNVPKKSIELVFVTIRANLQRRKESQIPFRDSTGRAAEHSAVHCCAFRRRTNYF